MNFFAYYISGSLCMAYDHENDATYLVLKYINFEFKLVNTLVLKHFNHIEYIYSLNLILTSYLFEIKLNLFLIICMT